MLDPLVDDIVEKFRGESLLTPLSSPFIGYVTLLVFRNEYFMSLETIHMVVQSIILGMPLQFMLAGPAALITFLTWLLDSESEKGHYISFTMFITLLFSWAYIGLLMLHYVISVLG